MRGALLTVGPFLVVTAYGRGRTLRWDVIVVGAIAYVVSEPFQILTAAIPASAGFWQALAVYVPLRVYGVRDPDEPVTLGLAFGGAAAVSAGLAVLLAAAHAGAPVGWGRAAPAAAWIAPAAGLLLWPAVARLAAEAVRSRRLRWAFAALLASIIAGFDLYTQLAVAIATWWVSSRLPIARSSDPAS